jgi:poly [ADP-ribose] polymerase
MSMERNATPNGKRIVYRKFVLSEISDNHNKQWCVGLYDSDDVEIEFGRVGVTNTRGVHRNAGISFVDKMVREKTAKGYQELKTIDVVNDSSSIGGSSSSTKKLSNTKLQDIAVQQIEHDSPEVAKLIRWLADVNRHNIIAATGGNITYDDNSGLFKTPLGIVTPDVVTEARDYLTTIGDYVNDYEKQGWPTRFDRKFENAIEQYLMRIPSNVGMKLNVRTFVPDLRAVQAQNQILDALDASYKQAITQTTSNKNTKQDIKTEQPKVFDIKLFVNNDNKIKTHIEDMYYESRNRKHYDAYDYRIKQIFIVETPTAKNQFEKMGKPIGNIMELFHGSSSSNLLNIMRLGLKTCPPSTAHITGKMFGSTGIYLSNQSSKSLNYSIGYWGGDRNNRVFMFICDTAMGKYYVPKGPESNLPRAGYDSTFAKAGISGVTNNEHIVYREYQVNLKYLLELGK